MFANTLSWFNFEGRIGRGSFWLRRLTMLIVSWPAYELATESTNALVVMMGFGALMVVIVGDFSTTAKRLHDRGYTGFLSLLFLIPIIGWLWGFVMLGCLPGEPGSNEYGPPQVHVSPYGGGISQVP